MDPAIHDIIDFVGILIGIIGALFFWVRRCQADWREAAIKHGAGRYHPETGKFEWNDEDQP